MGGSHQGKELMVFSEYNESVSSPINIFVMCGCTSFLYLRSLKYCASIFNLSSSCIVEGFKELNKQSGVFDSLKSNVCGVICNLVR